MTLSDDAIRSRLFDVLDNRLPVEDFQHWIVEHGTFNRTPLVVKLDHLFAGRALLTPGEFDDELHNLARTVEANLTANPSHERVVHTGAVANTLKLPPVRVGGNMTIRGRWQLADR